MFFTKTSLKNDDLNVSKIAIFVAGLASLLIIGNYNDGDTYEEVSPSFLSQIMNDPLITHSPLMRKYLKSILGSHSDFNQTKLNSPRDYPNEFSSLILNKC